MNRQDPIDATNKFASREICHDPDGCLRSTDMTWPSRSVGSPPLKGNMRTLRKLQQYAKSPET
jgi:hypothetical protein